MSKRVINWEVEKSAASILEDRETLNPSVSYFNSLLDKGLHCGLTNNVVLSKSNEAYEPNNHKNDIKAV